MKLAWTRFAVAVVAMAAVAAAATTPPDKAALRAALKQANADYDASMKQCRTSAGNARTICVAEAKAALRRSESDAQAKYQNTAHARLDARIASAKSDYAVAKAKCGDKAGNERTACVRAARTEEQHAIAEAMRTVK